MTYKDFILPGTIIMLSCFVMGYCSRGERRVNIVSPPRIDSIPYPVEKPVPYYDTAWAYRITRGTRDSLRRVLAEKNTIIEALQIKGGNIALNTIQPNAYTDKHEFAFDPKLNYIIQGNGTVTVDSSDYRKLKRREWWRKAGRTARDGGVLIIVGYGSYKAGQLSD